MKCQSSRLALLALCAMAACGPAVQAVNVGGGAHPAAVIESGPLPGDGAVVARWQQTLLSSGTVDAYLFTPGHAESACHLTTGAGRFDFHCENHPQMVDITGIDPFRPHVVSVTLDRAAGVTALSVTQDGAASGGRVTGTPDLPADGRLRLQVDATGGAAVRIDGFEAREVN